MASQRLWHGPRLTGRDGLSNILERIYQQLLQNCCTPKGRPNVIFLLRVIRPLLPVSRQNSREMTGATSLLCNWRWQGDGTRIRRIGRIIADQKWVELGGAKFSKRFTAHTWQGMIAFRSSHQIRVDPLHPRNPCSIGFELGVDCRLHDACCGGSRNSPTMNQYEAKPATNIIAARAKPGE